MLNYFKLIRAINTTEFDELTVKELKQMFDTEPDFDNNMNIGIIGNPYLHRYFLKETMMHHIENTGAVILMVDEKPQFLVSDANTINPNELMKMELKLMDPLTDCTIAFDERKEKKFIKQQNKYRSRFHKK